MKVSDKVICVNADFSMYPNISQEYKNLPIEGEFYHIRELKTTIVGKRVLLEEISNPPVQIDVLMGKAEPGFNAVRFKVVDPLTDLIIEEEVINESVLTV